MGGDVPLPGLNLDNTPATHEVTIYRPSNKYIYWIAVNQSASGNFYTRFESPIVHLPGLYDTDNKADFVTYNPVNARFSMLLSTQNWNVSAAITRNFDAALRPDAIAASDSGASAPAVRHGGVPLPAESAGRRVLRVWDPYTGNWHTMWDPVNSAALTTCQWGAARDIPLAGPIDRNADGKTDMVVYRPMGDPPAGGVPMVHVRSATASLCAPGGDLSFEVTGATARWSISAVRDMSGDARGDILVLDPDTFTWKRYYSQSFTPPQAPLLLGETGAMPL